METRTKRPAEKESSTFVLTNTGNPAIDPVTGITPTPTPTPTTATANNVPAEVSHCNWSSDGISGYQSSSTHIDKFTLCQSKDSDTTVYIQVKTPDTAYQVCLIPTYNSGSTITYLGEPRCLYITSATQIYKLTMLKNRQNFTTYLITGIMMMKDKSYQYPSPFYKNILSPDAYMFCANWLEQTNDSSYCQAFEQVGAYVYHQF